MKDRVELSRVAFVGWLKKKDMSEGKENTIGLSLDFI